MTTRNGKVYRRWRISPEEMTELAETFDAQQKTTAFFAIADSLNEGVLALFMLLGLVVAALHPWIFVWWLVGGVGVCVVYVVGSLVQRK